MISRTHRFHGFKSLSFVYKTGSVARGPSFAAKVAYNPRRSTYRAAVVVSRKVHKSAVGRNRIRRRLYAAVQAIEEGIAEPYDIVLSVYNENLLEVPQPELVGQLKKQLKELKVLGQKSKPKK